MAEAERTPAEKRWLDVVLAGTGAAFGWASLTYPFGRDQGLYFYVAREWVQRGAIPYRDVLDHKTPGIYVLHALCILLFGAHQWAIRIADLIGIVALGLVAASFTAERGERVRGGVRGASVIIASVLFYGFLDFWNTAQSELWYALLGLASIAAVQRLRSTRSAAATSGALAAASMVMKPPAVWFVVIAFALLVAREWQPKEDRAKRLLGTSAFFASGFMGPLAVMFAYFGAHHALGAMKDIVVGANSYYVSHETSIHDLSDVTDQIGSYYRFYHPLNTLLLIGLVAMTALHQRRRDHAAFRRYLLAVGLCGAGFLAVAMQKKFYLLHWTVVLGPATVVGALRVADLIALIRSDRGRAWQLGLALILSGGAYVATEGGPQMWVAANRNAIAHLDGKLDDAAFAETFLLPQIGFFYGHSAAVGWWVRDHSSPTDLLLVRGFDPEIYAVADRHYAGRFFWTTFLTSPVRAYRRQEWLAEDDAAFVASKPRYIITLSEIHEGPDATETYLPRGYVLRTKFDEFTVLERASDTPSH